MFLIDALQNIISAGTQQLQTWVTDLLPQVFLFLILLNAITRLIGRARVERLAARCGSNSLLRYLVLPFLSAVVLGNPMAISMGRYLPERCKPAYFASASYHCHTNSGIFQHINPAELFIWLGIANGILSLGLDPFPLALRYLCAGLAANFVSGYATELLTGWIAKKEGLHLSGHVHLEATGTSETEDPAGKAAGGTEHAGLRSITITCGDGGYGGPVTVTPTERRHIVLYMTGGGLIPEPLEKIVALSGMRAVNGNEQTVPDEEVALAIIDCGGTLRCGIYPGKGIPTVNLLATGRSGPLAKYMTEDLYVSAVTSAQVSPAGEAAPAHSPQKAARNPFIPFAKSAPQGLFSQDTEGDSSAPAAMQASPGPAELPQEAAVQVSPGPAELPQEAAVQASPGPAELPQEAAPRRLRGLLRPAAAVSKVISIFHQSARDAVRTCLDSLLPFMGFAALFIGICRGSGLTEFLASGLQPMGGSLPGLMGLGIICSIPGLSAVLGAGAVAAQMFSTVIGDLIAAGTISPAMALPALFAINTQCACDFIPVGLSMTEAAPDTTQVGMTSVTLSRFATGWIRILIALVFSIGLYR